jgi:hypothetical protein
MFSLIPFLILYTTSPTTASYTFPISKQGTSDSYGDWTNATILDALYSVFKNLQLGTKNYNVFWSDLESSGVN